MSKAIPGATGGATGGAGAALGGAAGAAVGQIAAKLLEPFVEPLLEAASTAARLAVMDALGVTPGIVKDTVAAIERGKPDAAFGYDNDGIVETLHASIWSAVKTMFVHPELADEFVMEMISEGVSNAMQYNIGGAIQSIINVWRGSYPPEPSDIDTYVGNQLDALDESMAFLAMAQSGANIPAAALYAVKGANENLQSQLGAMEARIAEHISRLESLALFFHEAAVEAASRVLAEALEEAPNRAEHIANMLRYSYERAAARLQEYLAELLQLKALRDAGVLNDTSASQLGFMILVEARALMEGVGEVEATLLNALESVTAPDFTEVVNELVALLAEVARVYVRVVQPVPESVNQLLDELHYKLMTALTTLTMTRTLHGDQYQTTPPIDIIEQLSESEVPKPQTMLPSSSAGSQESG